MLPSDQAHRRTAQAIRVGHPMKIDAPFLANRAHENKKAREHEEYMDIRTKLSTLWIVATLNYLYCDVMGLMDPGLLRQYLTGSVNGIQMTQGFLLGAAILVEIPMVMIALSRLAPYRLNRWANIGAGSVMTAVQLATVAFTPPEGYYIFCSIIEVICTVLIVWYAWTWREAAVQAKIAAVEAIR
jgi:hypothetical protein